MIGPRVTVGGVSHGGMALVALTLALAGCVPAPKNQLPAISNPPEQAIQYSPLTGPLRALDGEWLPRDARGNRNHYRLTIWGASFAWGAGCDVASGQLRDLGGGRYAVEPYGGTPENCRHVTPPAPFDGAEVAIIPLNAETIRVEAGGSVWTLAKVDIAATIVSDAFVRGEWLLADARGRPLQGAAATRVTFDDRGYRVAGPTCQLQINGWIRDRDWIVRPGGDQMVQSLRCVSHMLGDKLAAQGDAVRFVAEPEAMRMRVRIGRSVGYLMRSER